MTDDIEVLEKNLKSVGVLLATITMENLEALRDGVYSTYKEDDHLQEMCRLSYNHLNRLSKAIKKDLGAKSLGEDVERTIKDTLDIVYSIADLDETGRKRVSGLIAQIKKK